MKLVRQFLKHEPPLDHLFATCRDPNSASDLTTLQEQHPKSLHIIRLEVTDWDKHAEVADEVEKIVGAENGLNLLINNAGVLLNLKALDEITPDTMLDAYKTNCVAPIFLTRAFLPLLKTAASKADKAMRIHGGCVVEMSTVVGSIAENERGGSYSYRCSKTALNMGMKNLSLGVEKDGILMLAMHSVRFKQTWVVPTH